MCKNLVTFLVSIALVLGFLGFGAVFAQDYTIEVTDEISCSYREARGTLREGHNWANIRIRFWPRFVHLSEEYARELLPFDVGHTWIAYDAWYGNISSFIDWSRVTERYARDYYGWERSTGYDPYWIHEVNTSEGWVLESDEFYIPEITFVVKMQEETTAMNPLVYCHPSSVDFEWKDNL